MIKYTSQGRRHPAGAPGNPQIKTIIATIPTVKTMPPCLRVIANLRLQGQVYAYEDMYKVQSKLPHFKAAYGYKSGSEARVLVNFNLLIFHSPSCLLYSHSFLP